MNMPEAEPHRVVIVGGGFGGLQAALGLRRAPVDVTLVDRRNFHLFQGGRPGRELARHDRCLENPSGPRRALPEPGFKQDPPERLGDRWATLASSLALGARDEQA
jgi:choline dehydrogenase-like flavoprotein